MAVVRRTLAVTLSLLVVACGPGTGGFRVVDVSPSDGAKGVARAADVEILFSRAPDAATLSDGGIRLVPDRPFSLDVDGERVALTPDAPLPGGHPLRLVVGDTVTDQRGRRLRGGTFSSTFITASAPPAPLDVDAVATPHDLRLGFDQEGNGVAVWTLTKGFQTSNRSSVLYALYTASEDAWSEPAPLEAWSLLDAYVVSNGRSVLVHAAGRVAEFVLDDDGWAVHEAALETSTEEAIVPFGDGYAGLKRDFSGFQVVVSELGQWRASGDRYLASWGDAAALASDGDALALAMAIDDEVWLRVLHGDAWSAPVRVDDPLAPYAIEDVSLVGTTDGTGWLVAFVERDAWASSGDHAWARRYLRDGPSGVLEEPAVLGGSSSGADAPALAASDLGFAAAWRARVSAQAQVFAAIHPDPAAETVQWTAPTLLGSPRTTARFRARVLTDGARYGVFWSYGAFGTALDGALSGQDGGWTSAVALGSDLEGYQVAAGDGAFAVATEHLDHATWAHSGDGWQSRAIGAPGAVVFDPALTFDGSDLRVGFTENGTLRWSDGRVIVGPQPGSAGDPAIVATGDGRAVATWRQGVGGAQQRFVRVHDGADWQVPVPLGVSDPIIDWPVSYATLTGLARGAIVVWRDSSGLHAQALGGSWDTAPLDLTVDLTGSLAVAAHEDAAIVAWVEHEAGSTEETARVVRFVDGAFSAVEELSTGTNASGLEPLTVAVAATDGGFGVAVVRPSDDPGLAFFRWDGAWQPEQHRGQGVIEQVALDGYDGEYAVAWYVTSPRALHVSRTIGGDLAPSVAFPDPVQRGEGASLMVRGGPAGFVVGVEDHHGERMRVATCVDGAWSALDGASVGQHQGGRVAARDGFLTTWRGLPSAAEGRGALFARRWVAGAWRDPEPLSEDAEVVSWTDLFAAESGYVSTRLSTSAGQGWRLLATRRGDAGWEPASEVARGDALPSSVVVDVSPEGRVVAAWAMPDPNGDPRVWAAAGSW